jgi:hypothetical protein
VVFLQHFVSQGLYPNQEEYEPGIILSAQRDLRIRNRAILTVLFPIISFLFAVGWLLQYFGESKNIRALRIRQTTTRSDEMQFQIASTEEFEECDDERANIGHR